VTSPASAVQRPPLAVFLQPWGALHSTTPVPAKSKVEVWARARIGLSACRFHRIGGCSPAVCAAAVFTVRPRRRMAPRWRPASRSAPSTPVEWTNWREGCSNPASPESAIPRAPAPYTVQNLIVVEATRPKLPSCWPWVAGWLVGRGHWSRESCPLPAIGSDISGQRRNEQSGRLEAVSPRLVPVPVPVPVPGTNGTEPSAHRIARIAPPEPSSAAECSTDVPAATDVAMARRVIWAVWGRKAKETRGENRDIHPWLASRCQNEASCGGG
jgi:hypothetical protein